MEQLFFGDLVLIDTNPDAAKKQIAIVVSANVVNEYLHSVIICPLIHMPHFQQSRIGATFLPKEISCLEQDAMINYIAMTSISKEQIIKRIGTLPAVLLPKIKESLSAIFDIS